MNLLALISFVPFGLLRRSKARRRVARSRSLAGVPSAIGHAGGFCCSDCARAQIAGQMAWGTRCSPCGQATPTIPACDPLPYDEPAIDALVKRCCAMGLSSLQPIVLRVLTLLYPATPDGRPIPWAQVDERWSPCLGELATLVGARVTLLLASQDYMNAAHSWERNGMPVQTQTRLFFSGGES